MGPKVKDLSCAVYGDWSFAQWACTQSAFLAEAIAGDENPVVLECAICAKLNAIEAITDKSGWKEGKQCFWTSDSVWYHTTELTVWKVTVERKYGWDLEWGEFRLDILTIYTHKKRIIRVGVDVKQKFNSKNYSALELTVKRKLYEHCLVPIDDKISLRPHHSVAINGKWFTQFIITYSHSQQYFS